MHCFYWCAKRKLLKEENQNDLQIVYIIFFSRLGGLPAHFISFFLRLGWEEGCWLEFIFETCIYVLDSYYSPSNSGPHVIAQGHLAGYSLGRAGLSMYTLSICLGFPTTVLGFGFPAASSALWPWVSKDPWPLLSRGLCSAGVGICLAPCTSPTWEREH